MLDPMLIADAEVPRTNRIDRPYEVLSRPSLGRVLDTPKALLEFQAAHLAAHNRPAPAESLVAFVARVDFGRWLGDCTCGDAPVIDPEWSLACCFTCGTIYRTIVMPAEAADIEAALLARAHPINRFWFPQETVADLLAENAANAVVVVDVTPTRRAGEGPGVKG